MKPLLLALVSAIALALPASAPAATVLNFALASTPTYGAPVELVLQTQGALPAADLDPLSPLRDYMLLRCKRKGDFVYTSAQPVDVWTAVGVQYDPLDPSKYEYRAVFPPLIWATGPTDATCTASVWEPNEKGTWVYRDFASFRFEVSG